MVSNYEHYKAVFADDMNFLFEALKDKALEQMEQANNYLERENVTREFATRDEYNNWKANIKDAEFKYAVFAELLHDLNEAQEFHEWDLAFDFIK